MQYRALVLTFFLLVGAPAHAQTPGDYRQKPGGQGHALVPESPESLPEFAESGEAKRVAVVRDENGSFVEWFESFQQIGLDRIGIGIGASYPNKPLVSAEFLEDHSPLEIFLAVAEPSEPPPEELIRHAMELGNLPNIDGDLRYRLKSENETSLEDFEVVGSEEAQSCSAGFKNWVGQVFGDTSCGMQTSGEVRTRSTTYCTSCSRDLGSSDRGLCVPAIKPCDQVRGMDYFYAGRLTDWFGNPTIGYYGRWQHILAANCQGNGSFYFRRTRGSVQKLKTVPVSHAYHYYWGSWPAATAETNVTYGLWKKGLDPLGSTHVLNQAKIEGNAGPNDQAILCADIRYQRLMSDISSPSCQGPNVSLCTGPGDCDSACFDCAGGTCN